jgi:hypothetical protein
MCDRINLECSDDTVNCKSGNNLNVIFAIQQIQEDGNLETYFWSHRDTTGFCLTSF